MREGTQILLQVQQSRGMTGIVPGKRSRQQEIAQYAGDKDVWQEKVRGGVGKERGEGVGVGKKEQSSTEGGKRGEAGEGKARLGMVSHGHGIRVCKP